MARKCSPTAQPLRNKAGSGVQQRVQLRAQAVIRARVPGAFYRQLKIAAIQNGLTVTDVVKQALQEWLTTHAPDQAPPPPTQSGQGW